MARGSAGSVSTRGSPTRCSRHLYSSVKTKLESQNVVLQEAVQTGTSQLEQQEKELETAREIQTRLIPAPIPQLPGAMWPASAHMALVHRSARRLGGV